MNTCFTIGMGNERIHFRYIRFIITGSMDGIVQGEKKIITISFEKGKGGKRRICFRMIIVDANMSSKF